MFITLNKQRELISFVKSLNQNEVAFVLKHLKSTIGVTHIHRIPSDAMFLIFFYLDDTQSISNCARVCKLWSLILKDNFLWKQACARKSYMPLSRTRPVKKLSSRLLKSIFSNSYWKQIYIDNYMTWKNWTTGNYKVQPLIQLPGFLCVGFDDQRAISVRNGHPSILWELSTGKPEGNLHHDDGAISSLRFNDDIIVAGFKTGIIRVWNIKDAQWSVELVGHTNEVGALHILNNQLISGSEDHSIRIWDLGSGSMIQSLNGHSGAACTVQLGMKHAASGSTDSTVRIWDLKSGQCLHTLIGHEGTVFCVQFDDNYVCSGGMDASIIIWSFRTGKKLKTLTGHHAAVVTLQFDKSKIVSGSGKRAI